MAASGLTNTLPRSSCGKCVQVLKELISGLQQDEDTTNGNANANSTDKHNKHTNANANAYEPPPLTLLRAIARSSQDHPWHDKWGQEKQQMNSERFRTTRTINTDTTNTNTNTNTNTTSMASSISHAISHATRGPDETAEKLLHAKQQQSQAQPQPQQQSYPKLTIEETEDGVKVTIPVETTAPVLMKKWTQLEDPLVEEQQQEQQPREEPTTSFQQDDDEEDPIDVDEPQDWMPLATSVRRDDETTAHQPHTASPQQHPNATPSAPPTNPLTIEFKCRRCETSGPEAGARAFLMGPEPLSIVLCHNRIHSEPLEVEEILTHELVHLYDVQTLQLDLSDCETVAYSEVRAAREAECHRSVREAAAKAQQNAQTQTQNQQDGLVATVAKTWEERVYKPYCVKSIALGATQNMFPREGKSCLHKVWERAYGDHRPFGRNLAPPASNAPSKAASVARQQTTTQERPFDEHSGTIHGTSGK